jgi:hypothetical protein
VAQSSIFPFFVMTGLKIMSLLVSFGFLNLVLDVWIGNSDFRSRPKLNVDPVGSRSETLHPDKSVSG